MFWLCAISGITIVAASMSLWGAMDDRRDIRSGHPSLESLMSYSGIWNRDVFVSMLGEPDTNGRFTLPTEKIGDLPRSNWTCIFDNDLLDLGSIMLSIMAPIVWAHNWTLATSLLAIGAGAQAIGYTVAAIVTYRSGIWNEWIRDTET